MWVIWHGVRMVSVNGVSFIINHSQFAIFVIEAISAFHVAIAIAFLVTELPVVSGK